MLLQNRRQRKNTEKSKQEQELLQNLTRIERCNGGQTGKKREEKERDSEKCEKKVRKKQIKLSRCAFLLSGSALGGAVVRRLGG